ACAPVCAGTQDGLRSAPRSPTHGFARFPGSPSGPGPTAAVFACRAARAGTRPTRRRADARRTARKGWDWTAPGAQTSFPRFLGEVAARSDDGGVLGEREEPLHHA